MAAKTKPDMPPEVWLMTATDGLGRWAAAGQPVTVADITDDEGQPALVIVLHGITSADPRVNEKLAALVAVGLA